MTDQKRARVAEILGELASHSIRHFYSEEWAEAVERIDAIYSEGVEPVAWAIEGRPDSIPNAVWQRFYTFDSEAEAEACIAERADHGPAWRITALYASPPSESDGMAEAAEQFRKGYEEGERYTESLRNQLDAMRATRAHDKLKIEAQSSEIARLRADNAELIVALPNEATVDEVLRLRKALEEANEDLDRAGVTIYELVKALEEVKPQWLDYLEDMIGDRYRCICCNADEEDGGCATDFNSGWALVEALRRALSSTPEEDA